ncbi:MOSC domain-containing protein [Actinokineospora cianjurensis]|uniref:MOSC domain-containing protein n=1 Tax=Actinokineospora cianjurensis TaxID=585224 RepID=UPI000EAD9006|nr:MOSC N-terminal beta barrel domain-containing protein [Actinokineospora cianjurensis]
MARVSGLAYYPVKGFRAVPVTSADVVETGLVGDRQYMVVDAADGSFISQRKVPAMAAARAALVDGGLLLSLDGLDDHLVEVVPDGPVREVSMFNKWYGHGIDQGDLAAKWCSQALDREVRLVRFPPTQTRDGWGLHPGKVAFGDAHAILLITEASLADLNTRITATGEPPVPMDRFRPNITLTDWPAHAEDRAIRLRIGQVELGFSTRAIRCAVPTVDQRTGEKKGPEPTRTLATYRRDPDRPGLSFGAKYAVLTPGPLHLNDEATVVEG